MLLTDLTSRRCGMAGGEDEERRRRRLKAEGELRWVSGVGEMSTRSALVRRFRR